MKQASTKTFLQTKQMARTNNQLFLQVACVLLLRHTDRLGIDAMQKAVLSGRALVTMAVRNASGRVARCRTRFCPVWLSVLSLEPAPPICKQSATRLGGLARLAGWLGALARPCAAVSLLTVSLAAARPGLSLQLGCFAPASLPAV